MNRTILQSGHAKTGAMAAIAFLICTATSMGALQTHDAEKFVGTWELVVVERKTDEGEWIETDGVFGPDPVGVISYDAAGRMAVHIMRRERESFEGPANERAETVDGYVAYFGSYEVDAASGRVTHQRIGHLNPDLVGTDVDRLYAFSGNRLTLTVPPAERLRLVWQRVR